MEPTKIKFGFKKTAVKSKVARPVLVDPEDKEKDEREFIKSIEEKKINSAIKKTVAPKIQIPIINKPAEERGKAAEPTMDDYKAIPVEEFGLAMLRGMGWKDQDAKPER